MRGLVAGPGGHRHPGEREPGGEGKAVEVAMQLGGKLVAAIDFAAAGRGEVIERALDIVDAPETALRIEGLDAGEGFGEAGLR